MRNDTVSQESPDGMETGPIKPESDDEITYSTPHRELVAPPAAWRGRNRNVWRGTQPPERPNATPGLKRRPRGGISVIEGMGRSSGAITVYEHPTPQIFLDFLG